MLFVARRVAAQIAGPIVRVMAAPILFPWLAAFAWSVFAFSNVSHAGERGLACGLQTTQDPTATTTVDQQLAREQQQLNERYRQLEDKLFQLYQYEQTRNPDRSHLLKQAFDQSKGRLTSQQLAEIAEQLSKQDLKSAQDSQQSVLRDLNDLLTLLQSENRGQRVREKLQRFQDYLKEVDRLQRTQAAIRGQTEAGSDLQRAANSQDQTTERTEKLAQDIHENEEQPSDSRGNPPHAGDDAQARPDAAHPNGEPQPDENAETDADKTKPDDDSQPSDPSDRGANSESPPGAPSSGQPHSDSSDNPLRKRLDQATDRMRDASQKLRRAERGESVEQMRAAERELAEAKRELEEILRQLREEEAMRTLAGLESRFRSMLERQLKVLEQTKSLDGTSADRRDADFEIAAGKLAVDEATLGKDASSALMILNEDGTSAAFPETVSQMRDDMNLTAQRLTLAKVGETTQEIQRQIVDSLSDMIDALVQSQREFQRNADQNASRSARGEQGLLDQIAELKMLRGLQKRINARHEQYAARLGDPDDEHGVATDPDLQAALQRLSERQANLYRITGEILDSKDQ